MNNATVIMNTYNENPVFLKMAIQSYLDQKGVDIQLIISTIEGDENSDLLLSFMKESSADISIHVSPKNQHPGKSPRGSFLQINNALPVIKNDWFCFASSNDIAADDKILTEISICKSEKKQVCYSAFLKTDARLRKPKLVSFHDYDYQKHLKNNFVSDCALINTKLLQKYMPFNLEMNNYAYWDLWLRIYNGEGDVFCYNSKPTWFYRMDENSMHIQRKKNPTLMKQYEKDRNKMLKQYV